MSNIIIQAPAKINLGLEILQRRTDGYHDIKTIFVSVSLYDELRVEENDKIEIICDDKNVPLEENNSVYKALGLMRKTAKVYIKKRIPVKAGLGGGTADAAAVLKYYLRSPALPLDPSTTLRAGTLGATLGASIGSDVPYQMVGGTKLGCGRGEILTDLPSLTGINIVICVPEFGVETKWAYENVDYSRIGKGKIDKLIYDLRFKNIKKICSDLHNDFEYWVLPKYPEILKIKKDMVKYGALGALMTGSGSGVFGICESEKKAKIVFEKMKKRYKKSFLVKVI